MKRIKPSTILIIILALSILSTTLSIFYSTKLMESLKKVEQEQENRIQSLNLADELRQSSDNLTKFARMYIITSDVKYKNYYNDIVDIRSGLKRRPLYYNDIYWDLKLIGHEDTSTVDPISFEKIMTNLNFTDIEFELLKKSKNESTKLIEIEEKSFSIVENFTNVIESEKLIFSTEYLKHKSNIMIPISEFKRKVDDRTKISIRSYQKQADIYLVYTIILSIASLIFLFVLMVTLYITDKKNYKLLFDLNRNNNYLEHAAKILRHDMHSGINTYIPRGVSSLEKRLTDDNIKKLKIESPLKMIKEGLLHTQKVYKGVYEFTNLVKKGSVLSKSEFNLKDILVRYLKSTSYSNQVNIKELTVLEVNESLFCTAIDNLIKNGLKYNDSDSKFVNIYIDNGYICIQDNGRGMSQQEFEYLSKPYMRKKNQNESGSGLGLNICKAILEEHGFEIFCEKNKIGTKIKIKIK
jgi:biopolymer transport protein ExbB/TolQ